MLEWQMNSEEYNGAILPVSEVLKATARAKESAATQTTSEDSSDSADSQPADSKSKSDGEKEDADKK
jgi:hypothetical protein